MKSSLWSLCIVTLLCLASAKSKILQNHGVNILDEGNDKPTHWNENLEFVHNEAVNKGFDILNIMQNEPDPHDEKCKTKCGDNYKYNGVICKTKPEDEGVTCTCEDGKILDGVGEKKCKVDLCIYKCGVAFKQDGDVLCKGDPLIADSIECQCKDKDSKFFDKDVKECRAHCSEGDCSNGAKCENEFCKCLRGTSGDFCKIVNECETGELKECKDSIGTCLYSTDDRKAYCKCTDDSQIFDKEENVCAVDRCVAKCGVAFKTNGDVLCKGNPLKVEEIECVCKDKDVKFFDKDLKLCRAPCSSDGDCKNGAKCEKKLCKCLPGTSGDFCDIVNECGTGELKECKDDIGTCLYSTDDKKAYCKCTDDSKIFDKENNICSVDQCGVPFKNKVSVLCKGNPFKVEEIECECKEKNVKFFDEDVKDCRAHCSKGDCNNGATCENEFCKCLPGTSGDFCKIVKECETGELKECKDNMGTCLYSKDDEKAYCKCTDVNKIFNKEKHVCAAPCSSNEDCKNGAKCENKVCKCLPETSGDFCDIVNECKTGELQVCKDDIGTCLYSTDDKKAYCKCTDVSKIFDKEKRVCAASCSSNDDCKNGAKCEDKLCKCLPGTSGDLCEVINECKTGELKECMDSIGTCLYSTGDQKAYCKCTDDSQIFDKENNICAVDQCVAKCGVAFKEKNGDVLCNGDPFKAETIECECEEEYVKSFDKEAKLCRTKCTKNEDCNNGAECKDGFCRCLNGTTGDTCHIVTECETGELKVCANGKGVCKYSTKDKKAYCSCDGGQKFFEELHHCEVDNCLKKCGEKYEYNKINCVGKAYKEDVNCSCKDDNKHFDSKEQTCKGECTKGDCVNGGTCEKYCNCLPGTTGETCEIITECESGKYKECKDDNGKCVYLTEKQTAYCNCTDAKQQFYEKKHYCEVKCTKDDDCSGGKECNVDGFCACKKGYGGKECKEIIACKDLEKTCEEAGAKCVLDYFLDPKCECNDDEYRYDKTKEKCVALYCMQDNRCGGESECDFDSKSNTGYCKCKEERKYYNYETKECKTLYMDECLLRKEQCGDITECSNGYCYCKDGYDTKGDGCFRVCYECFTNANCSADALCYCPKGLFYDGNGCKDAKCFLKDFKKECSCPIGFKKNEAGTDCVPNNGEACKKECGFGFCKKVNDDEKCQCIPSVATAGKDGSCILNSEKVCPSGIKLTEDSKKCNCNGKYKEAKDGITCELITCDDQIAKDDCAAKGTTCKMQWKGPNAGYNCICPTGYTLDEQTNACTDKCSLDEVIAGCSRSGQVCYNSIFVKDQSTLSHECKCPPPLKDKDGQCSQIAENVYFIHNIRILKNIRYMMDEGKINEVLLNSDIMESLKQTFGEDIFDYGYLGDYKVEEDVLKCLVWVQFKKTPDQELKRIQFQTSKFNISEKCQNCYDYEDKMIWPPNLVMHSSDLEKIEYEEVQTLCSNFSRTYLCGKGAQCKEKENKCYCPKGFKTVDFSVRNFQKFTIQRCEDIDECESGANDCHKNTTCVNTLGDYKCQCNEGFKKVKESEEENDKGACVDVCIPSPCKQGSCSLVNTTFECNCNPGFAGRICEKDDLNFASAKKSTVIVGAILGTILGVGLIAFILFYRKVRKSAQGQDNPSEMNERRPVRGVVNNTYE